MGFTANEKQLLATACVLMPATMLAIGLRFYSRQRLKAKKGPDDWFALASGIVFWADCIACIWGILKGFLGVEPLELSLWQLETALKMSFAGIYLMATILTLARFSVLFLYHRIFGIYRGFNLALIGTGLASISWWITIVFLSTFRCSPVKGAWDPFFPSNCLNLETIFLITETINAILDIFLMCLPLTKIQFVQLSLRDRIGLSIVFLTGIFVGATSILRIVFTYNPTEKGAVLDSIFWLYLQLATAIICACLPTLRSLLPSRRSLTPLSSAFRRLIASRMTATSSKQASETSTSIPASGNTSKSLYDRYTNLSKSDDGVALTNFTVECHSTPQV